MGGSGLCSSDFINKHYLDRVAVLVITVVLGTLFAVLFDLLSFSARMFGDAAGDSAFFRHADGECADLEEHDDAPGVGVFGGVHVTSSGLQPIDWFKHAPAIIHHHHCVVGVAALCDFLILFTSDQESGPGAEGSGGGGRFWAERVQFFFLCDARAFEPSGIGVVVMIETIFLLSDLCRDLHDDLRRTWAYGDDQPGVFGLRAGLAASLTRGSPWPEASWRWSWPISWPTSW